MSSTDLERRIQARLQKHQEKLREHKSRIVDHQEWLKTMASSVLGSEGGAAADPSSPAPMPAATAPLRGAVYADSAEDPEVQPSPARVHISRHGSVSIRAGGAMPLRTPGAARSFEPPRDEASQQARRVQAPAPTGRRAMDYQSHQDREIAEMRPTVRGAAALALRGAALGRNCIAHAHPSPALLCPPLSSFPHGRAHWICRARNSRRSTQTRLALRCRAARKARTSRSTSLTKRRA